MTNASTYTSYHAFYWWLAKFNFVRRMKKIGGEVLAQTTERRRYVLKVNNPNGDNNAARVKGWMSSNKRFWAENLSKP